MKLNDAEELIDTLELVGMRFEACHGCLPEEQATPQPFVVDVTLFLPLKTSADTDDIAATVDYTAIYAETKKIVSGKSVKLIETLAQNIAEAILKKYCLVRKIRVTVHKPSSPLMHNLTDVKTTIERSQDDA